jgi:hypothetical protein
MVLTGITDAVRSQVAGRLNNAVKSVTNPISFLNSFAQNQAGGKFKTDVMAYPSNVDSDPQQGHHIIFNLNTFKPGKLKHAKKAKDYPNFSKDINSEGNIVPTGQDDDSADDDIAVAKTTQYDGLGTGSTGRGGKSGGSILAQKPTKRLDAVIALYMPPSVSVSYDVKYADQEIGTLAMLGKDAVEAFMANKGSTESKLNAAADALGPGAKEGFTNLLNASLDTLAPGARALQQIESGKVITPRMEMMFEGVGRRSFSYTFAFIPKSAQEAKTIERIIYAFKENMMPEYSNPNTRREMNIPNVFDIQYMYQSTENKFLNKISTCFLQKIDVTYGADRYTAYDPVDGSPPPQKSSITLNFVEMETLSRDMIKEGF